MKRSSIVALMILVVSISACGPGQLFGSTLTTTPTNTLTPTNTPTPTSTPTPTNTPTPTFTPTPTPTGGGGKIYLWAQKNIFDNISNPDTDYGYFSVNLDGSGLTPIEQSPFDVSPQATEPTHVIGSVTIKLFSSPDNSTFYWASGDHCNSRGLCNEHYYKTNLDGSEQQEIWQDIKNASYNITISPSGKFIAYEVYYDQGADKYSKGGCYTATIDNQNATRVANNYTLDCQWSPKDDILLFWQGEGKGDNYKTIYSLLYMADGSIVPLPDIQAKICNYSTWVSDTQIFIEWCTDSLWKKDLNTPVGPRLVDIETSSVTVYPVIGFCSDIYSPPAFSPDRRWAILYNCDQDIFGVKPLPSQLLNLETGETKPIFNGLIPTDYIVSRHPYRFYWLP